MRRGTGSTQVQVTVGSSRSGWEDRPVLRVPPLGRHARSPSTTPSRCWDHLSVTRVIEADAHRSLRRPHRRGDTAPGATSVRVSTVAPVFDSSDDRVEAVADLRPAGDRDSRVSLRHPHGTSTSKLSSRTSSRLWRSWPRSLEASTTAFQSPSPIHTKSPVKRHWWRPRRARGRTPGRRGRARRTSPRDRGRWTAGPPRRGPGCPWRRTSHRGSRGRSRSPRPLEDE